jgi:hypothetical protein
MRKNGEQMISIYKKLLSIFSVCTIVIFIGCNKDTKTQESNSVEKVSAVAENVDPDCVEYVALWAAGDIAERIGKDKKWVFLNYTVDLWDTPPAEGEGSTVGKLRASSYARIIEKRDDDYKVESPVNQVQGWISSEHVKTTSWKNPKTRKLCK